MVILWIILGIILLLAGLADCNLLFLSGPPLCFIALLLSIKNGAFGAPHGSWL